GARPCAGPSESWCVACFLAGLKGLRLPMDLLERALLDALLEGLRAHGERDRLERLPVRQHTEVQVLAGRDRGPLLGRERPAREQQRRLLLVVVVERDDERGVLELVFGQRYLVRSG